MGKIMRSYGAFTTVGYRIALAAFPLGFVLVAVLCLRPSSAGGAVESVLTCYVAAFEVLVDYWLFGGILKRGGAQLGLFQTSRAGTAILGRSALGDCVRRFVYLLLYGLLCFALTGERMAFASALAVYVAATALLNATRHMQIVQMHMLLAFAAMPAYVLLMAAVRGFASLGAWLPVLFVLLCLAIGVSALTVWHIVYCVKGSYYEK